MAYLRTRAGWRNFIPDAVLRHEQQVRVPVPSECPKCGAGVSARRDDGAGHVGCVLCGWELLLERPIREAAKPYLQVPRGRGRGRR